jgi:tetratricopeptide (TPR) repeat protein
MTGKKKITKKKLKEPDEFVTFTEKAFLYITQHLRPIATGGIIVLILLLSIYIFYRWEAKKEGEAQQKFNLAVETYQIVSSPQREGSIQEYKDVLKKFDEVTKKFPRTSSGKLSILYKGNIHLRLREFEEGIKAYQTFLQKGEGEKLYRLFALEGLGYAYEGKKDYEKALTTFQKIVEIGESFELANAYLNIGRCEETLGKNKEALESYKNYLKVSQKSYMTNIVLRKISRLEK